MRNTRPFISLFSLLLLPVIGAFCAGCGGDDSGTGPEEEITNANLMGQVTLVGSSSQTSGIEVSVGSKSTTTSNIGSFSINHIPLGDQAVSFSGGGVSGTYTLSGIESGSTFNLQDIEIGGGLVKTAHTGTWVGTAGSTDPGSQGQIAFTLIIQANGNALSGNASVAPPDNSVWSMSGIETGSNVEGIMALVSTNSSCATGATFTGTFTADTLAGNFTEVNPPAGCGSPESGTFRVVKQQ